LLEVIHSQLQLLALLEWDAGVRGGTQQLIYGIVLREEHEHENIRMLVYLSITSLHTYITVTQPQYIALSKDPSPSLSHLLPSPFTAIHCHLLPFTIRHHHPPFHTQLWMASTSFRSQATAAKSSASALRTYYEENLLSFAVGIDAAYNWDGIFCRKLK
jgi:hypothetical protein